MELFGLSLPAGRGQVGGDDDEFRASLHPDDKHMMAQFHRTADKEELLIRWSTALCDRTGSCCGFQAAAEWSRAEWTEKRSVSSTSSWMSVSARKRRNIFSF